MRQAERERERGAGETDGEMEKRQTEQNRTERVKVFRQGTHEQEE